MTRREHEYGEAAADLELYFGGADAILGLHGSGFESGGRVVWDDLRIHHAHMAPRFPAHRENLRQLAAIELLVKRLSSVHWAAAFMTLTPHGWPAPLQRELSRGERGGNLVGLALTGEVLRNTWVRLEYGKRMKAAKRAQKAGDLEEVVDIGVASLEPTPLELMAFAVQQAELTDPSQIKHFFDPVRKESERYFQGSLAAYDGLLRDRRETTRQAAREEARG